MKKHLLPLLGLLVLFLFATKALALEQAACDGKDLFAQLKQNDEAAAAKLEKLAADTVNAEALLWKIESAGGRKISYILGTAHLSDSRIATVSESIRNKIAKSKILLLELQESQNKNGMAAAAMLRTEKTLMPEGQDLWQLVPDDKEEMLARKAAAIGIPSDMLSRFQPWMVMSAVQLPVCEVLRRQSKFTLDEALAFEAQIARIDIAGLETIDEQLNALANASLEKQAKLLEDFLLMPISSEDGLETLVQLYLNRRIPALEPLLAKVSGGAYDIQSADYVAFQKLFITDRNVNMAQRAQVHINEGGAFIAVGAAHLPGNDGVIALLRKAGNKVTPLE